MANRLVLACVYSCISMRLTTPVVTLRESPPVGYPNTSTSSCKSGSDVLNVSGLTTVGALSSLFPFSSFSSLDASTAPPTTNTYTNETAHLLDNLRNANDDVLANHAREQELSEEDYRKLMLEEYTFLKRPFMINEDEVFIGNAKKTVAAAVESFQS